MRIVHIIWGLETGGAETMLVDIINEQVKSQEVALVVVNNLINENLFSQIDKRCSVKLCHRRVGSKNPYPWVILNVFLLRYHPDIIHFHLEGMRNMVFYPAKKVFTIHNMHTSSKEYSSYKALYAISDAVKERTKEQGYASTTILNGIHPELIKVKEYCCAKKTVFRIVCVGRLYVPHKGQDVLIEALGLLKKKQVFKFHLDLIGDGESRTQLESLIKENELEREVTIMGQRSREYIYTHLCDYDMFVLPSRNEGFGLTIAEAMCAKVPVIVSDLQGPLEVIGNGKYGTSFVNGDANDLKEKLSCFILNGVNVEQVEDAYLYSCTEYDISETAKKYLEAYNKVIKS